MTELWHELLWFQPSKLNEGRDSQLTCLGHPPTTKILGQEESLTHT